MYKTLSLESFFLDITYSQRLSTCLNCWSIFSQALLIDLRAPFHNRLSTPACVFDLRVETTHSADLTCTPALSIPANSSFTFRRG